MVTGDPPPPPPLEDHLQGRIPGPRIIDTANGRQWRLRLRNPGPIASTTETASASPCLLELDTSSDGGPFSTVEFWREQVRLKDLSENAYLMALLNEPWFGDMLTSPGSGTPTRFTANLEPSMYDEGTSLWNMLLRSGWCFPGHLWRKKARTRLLKELTESYAVLVYIRRSRLRQGRHVRVSQVQTPPRSRDPPSVEGQY